MCELFIYWRVAAKEADAALSACAAFQAAQCARHAGLSAALYRRHGDAGGAPVTVMETYALPMQPGGIGPDVQAALTAAGNEALAAWCQGQRHVEAFHRVIGARLGGAVAATSTEPR